MAKGDRWWEDEEEDSPKEKVEEMLDKAEVNRLRREEELAQAKHDAEIAELERRELEAKGRQSEVTESSSVNEIAEKTIPSEIQVDSSSRELEGGVLGLWWLTPMEAVSIGISGILVIFFFGMGTVVSAGESEWLQTEATITKSEHGWEVYEVEECYDEYDCYYYDVIDCFGYLDYSYIVDDMEYVGLDRYIMIYTTEDYVGAEYDCADEFENMTYSVGSQIPIWYDTKNPEKSSFEEYFPGSVVLFFCCVPIFLLLLVVTLLNARFSNTPKFTYSFNQGFSGSNQNGDVVVHHHHHGGNYGSRMGGLFAPLMIGRRRGRLGGRSGRSVSRRRISGGGRSRGGGRGGGGRGGGGRGGGGRGR
tara:strand:- start:6557 stop:7642 length:1086 start_codon:yes stop_codon:yes gene_type:complete